MHEVGDDLAMPEVASKVAEEARRQRKRRRHASVAGSEKLQYRAEESEREGEVRGTGEELKAQLVLL